MVAAAVAEEVVAEAPEPPEPELPVAVAEPVVLAAEADETELAEMVLLPHWTERQALMPMRSLGWASTQLLIQTRQI